MGLKVETTDFDTIFRIIREYHWKSVGLRTMWYNRTEIEKWLECNCDGKVRYHAALFAFSHPEDAVLFALRWL